MKQTLIWTALPREYDPATRLLHLSVRVSPRLETGGPDAALNDFADFRQWAGTPVSFALQFGSLPGLFKADLVDDRRDPKLWQTVFPPLETRVENHRFEQELTGRRVRSFPVADVLGYIRDCYQKTGMNHPDELPPNQWLTGGREQQPGLLGPLAELMFPESVQKQFDKNYPHVDGITKFDFYQALLFHSPKRKDYAALPQRPDLDFHRTLSMVEQHDPIMRRLGLVFDLCCLKPDGLELAPPNQRWIRVIPSWKPQQAQPQQPNVRPRTAYELEPSSGRFAAAPLGTDIRDGLLDLSGDDYETVQVDVDGAAIKLVDFARTLYLLQGKPASEMSPEKSGLPALRSAGFSVVRTGRGRALSAKLERAGALNADLGDDLLFHAEDLVRGYRVDIMTAGPKPRWRSLCWRKGVYRLRPDPAKKPAFYLAVTEEGSIATAVTSGQGSNPDLYLHEALFHWDGWSLAVRRPGKAVPDPQHAPPGVYVADGGPDQGDACGLVTELTLPRKGDSDEVIGTLPRLRFGRGYRLRVRTVDLAGNGPASTENDSDLRGATKTPITYRRFEPVASPTLSKTAGFVPGESLERMVIRGGADSESTTAECLRVVCPPRISQQTAEQHGMFDRPAPEGSWYDILVAHHGTAAHLDEAVDPALADVPYLPDPLASQAVLRELPGDEAPRTISFSHSRPWPSAAPFRIRLAEGSGPSEWDDTSRTLTVRLPRSATATLRISSCLAPDQDLDLLGQWDWIRQAAGPSRLALLEDLARSGCHWMLTPFRELKLVHAVQTPCEPPRFEGLKASRKPGDGFVTIDGEILVHGASTGKVELRCSWKDRLDDPAVPGSGNDWSPLHQSHAFDLVNEDPARNSLGCGARRHEFGDTRYRRVAYEVTATSRFREYFDPGLPMEPFTLAGSGKAELDILNAARPLAPQIEYLIPTFEWQREEHPDGIGSRRSCGVRIYLKRPWFSSGDGELLGVILAHGPVHKPAACVVPNNLKGLVTQWGYDPIWLAHPAYQLPIPRHFPLAVASATGVIIDEALTRPLDPSSWWLSVAGHAVSFDAERQLWYCDIAMETGPAYFPFVRLALARYQPRSLWGSELSKVVLADFMQIAPDRLAWVTPIPGNDRMVEISVSGPAPLAGMRRGWAPTIMAVRAEMLHPGEGDQAWLPQEPGWIPLDRSQITPAATVWTGLVPLSAPRGSRRFRLVIGEVEVLPTNVRRSYGALGYLPDQAGFRPTYVNAIEI